MAGGRRGGGASADCGPAVPPASAWLRLGKSLCRGNLRIAGTAARKLKRPQEENPILHCNLSESFTLAKIFFRRTKRRTGKEKTFARRSRRWTQILDPSFGYLRQSASICGQFRIRLRLSALRILRVFAAAFSSESHNCQFAVVCRWGSRAARSAGQLTVVPTSRPPRSASRRTLFQRGGRFRAGLRLFSESRHDHGRFRGNPTPDGYRVGAFSAAGPAKVEARQFRAGGSTLHPIKVKMKVNQGQSRLIKVVQGQKRTFLRANDEKS